MSGDTWTFGTSQITPDSDADIAGNPLFLCPIEFSQTTAGVGAGCWYGTNGVTFGARAAAFSVSGTTLTWGTSSVIDTGDSTLGPRLVMSFNPQDAGSFITCNGETSVAGSDTNTYLSRISITSTNLTATNLLGVASGAILDTATGTINTWGSRNEVQTGLTIASDYYVQTDGTITTTSTSPAQLIGTAISATQINIKDYTG